MDLHEPKSSGGSELESLTPKEIVQELDRYIIGQNSAKRSVAIALRNRWRRQRVPDDLREEILPNNILMIGPTGVGKTEIARRLARLSGAPFLKVEATKFTEVGYVGRDVESMVRDLVEISVSTVKAEFTAVVRTRAEERAEGILLELLLPRMPVHQDEDPEEAEERRKRTREKLRRKLEGGELEDRTVTVEVPARSAPSIEIFSTAGLEEMDINLPESLSHLFPGRKKRRDLPVGEAREILIQEETEKLVDMENVIAVALDRAQESGIIFLDELDKIAGGSGGAGPDVSREGVQRDLLPLVEGSTVSTKYGVVRTDHILFIAAGAFHMSRPADLIPELQGRFPIRVELSPLGEDDFVRILTEPENALVKQYTALVATEGCRLEFREEAIREIARVATQVNDSMQNIGARRLQTIMTSLLGDLLFALPDGGDSTVVLTAETVRSTLKDVLEDEELTRYIL